MSPPSAAEAFQPRAHWAPTTPFRRLLFSLRLTADLQMNTVDRDLRRRLAGFAGKILDVGCGNSPFRHLLDPATSTYQGIDVPQADSFGYRNPDTVYFDGRVIPFADGSFDAVMCTEVLEHVADPTDLIREMHRVLKPGGFAVITIPWSARFHYQPHDYHRYTPSMLGLLFGGFARCTVTPRGTDLTSIASKIVVAYLRNLLRLKPAGFLDWVLVPLRLLIALIGIPFLAGALLLGHAGIRFGLGSPDDPLGYTVVVTK